jgi:hypothetical protein
MFRRRWIIALGVVVGLLVAAEVAVRRWERPRACLRIVNEADETAVDMVVTYDGSRVPVGNLPAGQRTQVWLSAGPPGPLRLDYRQKKNALQGFEIADYDPAQCINDAFKQVLVIQTNQVQRYMEDDETRMERESLGSRFLHWLQADLDARR